MAPKTQDENGSSVVGVVSDDSDDDDHPRDREGDGVGTNDDGRDDWHKVEDRLIHLSGIDGERAVASRRASMASCLEELAPDGTEPELIDALVALGEGEESLVER